MKQDKIIQTALKYAYRSVGRNIHVSLLVIRNKVISWGVNSYLKTSPKSYKNRFFFIHSEWDAIRRFNHRENNIRRASLYNFRFARLDSSLLISKPCDDCYKLVTSFGVRSIFYTTENGLVQL